MNPAEKLSALTDFCIAAECFFFCTVWLRAEPKSRTFKLSAWFFLSVGLASLFGGLVHGYFYREETVAFQILWRVTLLTIGVVSFFFVKLTDSMSGGPNAMRERLIAFVLFSYSAIVVFLTQKFIIAIFAYLPALLWFCYQQVSRLKSSPKKASWGIGATVVVLLASGLQSADVGLMALDANTLYHLLQMAAMVAFFKSI